MSYEKVPVPDRPGLEPGARGDNVKALHRVLAHFDYVTLEEADESSVDDLIRAVTPSVADTQDEFTEVTENALKRLQTRWGLHASGVLDQETFDALQGLSCLSAAAPVWDLLVQPDDKKMTYNILNFPSGLNAARVVSAVSQSFAFWASATPLSFRRVTGNDADITVRFISLGGPEGVLANALIELDDDERWRLGAEEENIGGASYDLVSVLVHEIGHKLGLHHVANSSSVMSEFMSHSDEHRQVGSFDAASIRDIYGTQVVLARPAIHGNTTRVEHPDRLALERATGPAGVFVGVAQPTWLHIGPTIPDLVRGNGVRLHNVRLKLRIHPGARITEIHIWDGDRVLEKHVLELGSVAPDIVSLVLGAAAKPILVDGLEISIGVAFNQRHPDVDRRIDIISASCDLIERGGAPGMIAMT